MTGFGLNEVQFCLCVAFSVKEVLSKHVDVEYRFSAEPYISASSSNVSVLSMLCLRAKKTL
ncbi:YobF family protein [Salmonella enterica subsp. enterica serovar Newport]|nr:YobF family protein [Salmonella enterica subsp. enterica serovar Saintpaul]EEF5885091.1 DUF2627 domain-containing protein [Salmonella enterica subsp. enterica serovar Newport]EEF5923277.1 DUF2627 domain-containing protein [Salmonella enterica]EFT9517002.1 YobF family protein [Salmonella enterica subsp. enterica serovar Wangata]EFQ3488786.1 YobF family protein [Salmonella enterica subsp. enterica serovar Newport]